MSNSQTADLISGVTDDRARELATDPRRSVLLQAPAGSGKTTVLTQRLLRLLAEVGEPEEILAITFTRKAAAEMRARVLKALRGEIEGKDAQSQKLRKLADAALKRASARGWNLAQDPGRLRIQTIDSFNFRLASQLPVTAKAGGSLLITDRPTELYHRSARQALVAAENDAELSADVELLFDRLDNQWGNVERLLASMLEQRGHWLRYVLGHDPGMLCARISESLTNIVRDHLRRACEVIPYGLRAEAVRLPGVESLGAEAECLEGWKSLARLTLTVKGEWRKPNGVNKSLAPEYRHPDSKDALRSCLERLSMVNGARETLLQLAALPAPTLSEPDAAAIRALARVLRNAAGHLQAEFAVTGRVDHTYVGGAARAALADAGLPTDFALQTGLSLRHILIDEFQDTSQAQLELLEALTAGWEERDGRTLFVVGDPMQSIYQFREAEVGLFLRARDHGIGAIRLEPMRLTRNFRSTPELIGWTNEVFTRLFPPEDDLRASAVAFTPSLAGRSGMAASASSASCTSGPRTGVGQGGVLGQLQLAFELIEPAPHGMAAEWSPDRVSAEPDPQRPIAQAVPDETQPTVELRLFPNDRQAETAAITERIADLRRRDAKATVAVLVASRTHAAPIMAALEQRGIETIGVDLVPLGELSIVRDLVALLQALHHLGDRTAWLAVLRAPWCGVTLTSLTALSRRNDSLLVWEAMAHEERLASCTFADRERVVRIREVLAQALATRDQGPVADWLETTWLQLGAADAYPSQELRHARAFLDAVSDRAAAGEWSGPEDLGSLLAELYAQPQAPDAEPGTRGAVSATAAAGSTPVQIMTIHRAKGLEFDHVFVPSLDRDLNRGREPLLRWLDLPRAAGHNEGRSEDHSDLIMAPVPPIGDETGGDVGRYLKRLIRRRAANEQIRLLYVAVTRSKHTLHLSASPKPKQDGTLAPRTTTLLASLWPALGDRFDAGGGPVNGDPSNVGGAPSADVEPGVPHGARPGPGSVPLRRLITNWTSPDLDATPGRTRLPVAHQSLEPPEFSWVGETARHIGTVVHAAFEELGDAEVLPSPAWVEDQRAAYLRQLRRHGVPEGQLEAAAELVVDAVRRTVSDQRGRWIFSPEHADRRSELALTGLSGGRLTNVIIDRSFIDREGTRWVIDFKTSRHEGGGLETFLEHEMDRYRPQLETYRTLARALGSHPVRAGLYFPLLGVFRELNREAAELP